jgi:hypothetical protein
MEIKLGIAEKRSIPVIIPRECLVQPGVGHGYAFYFLRAYRYFLRGDDLRNRHDSPASFKSPGVGHFPSSMKFQAGPGKYRSAAFVGFGPSKFSSNKREPVFRRAAEQQAPASRLARDAECHLVRLCADRSLVSLDNSKNRSRIPRDLIKAITARRWKPGLQPNNCRDC